MQRRGDTYPEASPPALEKPDPVSPSPMALREVEKYAVNGRLIVRMAVAERTTAGRSMVVSFSCFGDGEQKMRCGGEG